MTIFNPLDALDEVKKPLESTSSLLNDVQGVCPKCKKPFGTGNVGGDTIYYCTTCRVSQPIPQ